MSPHMVKYSKFGTLVELTTPVYFSVLRVFYPQIWSPLPHPPHFLLTESPSVS